MDYNGLFNSVSIIGILICLYLQHREIIDLYKEVFKLKQQKEDEDGC